MTKKRSFAELRSRVAPETQDSAETIRVSGEIALSEQEPETVMLLKVLALGNQDAMAGRTNPALDVIARLRAKG